MAKHFLLLRPSKKIRRAERREALRKLYEATASIPTPNTK